MRERRVGEKGRIIGKKEDLKMEIFKTTLRRGKKKLMWCVQGLIITYLIKEMGRYRGGGGVCGGGSRIVIKQGST